MAKIKDEELKTTDDNKDKKDNVSKSKDYSKYTDYKKMINDRFNELLEIAKSTNSKIEVYKLISSNFNVQSKFFKDLADKQIIELIYKVKNQKLGIIQLENEEMMEFLTLVVRTNHADDLNLNLDTEKVFHAPRKDVINTLNELDANHSDHLDKKFKEEEQDRQNKRRRDRRDDVFGSRRYNDEDDELDDPRASFDEEMGRKNRRR